MYAWFHVNVIAQSPATMIWNLSKNLVITRYYTCCIHNKQKFRNSGKSQVLINIAGLNVTLHFTNIATFKLLRNGLGKELWNKHKKDNSTTETCFKDNR